MPVEMQQIETEIRQAVVTPGREVLLKLRETGIAALRLRDHLAVDQRLLGRQPGDRLGNRRKFLLPVEPLAGQEPDVTVVQACLDAIAVELDLVNPARVVGSSLAYRCKARRNEIRQRCTARGELALLCLGLLRLGLGLLGGGWRAGAAGPAGRGGFSLARRGFGRAGALGRRGRLTFGRAGFHVVLDTPVRMPDALLPLAFGDLGDRSAGDDGERLLFKDVGIACLAGGLVMALHQKPVGPLLTRLAAQTDEMPRARQLLAGKRERQVPLLQGLVRIALGLPGAAIPDHHGAAAVLALRDRALERVVFDRVILHLDGEPLLAGNEARPAGHRPALHHPVELEAEIVVQASRRVFLNDELIAGPARLDAARLGRHGEIALGAIGLQRHVSPPVSCGAVAFGRPTA